MPKIFLAPPAEAGLHHFLDADRKRTLEMLHTLQNDQASLHPIRVRSDVLGTFIFMVRDGNLRLLYEIEAGRIIVLAVRAITRELKKRHSTRSHVNH